MTYRFYSNLGADDAVMQAYKQGQDSLQAKLLETGIDLDAISKRTGYDLHNVMKGLESAKGFDFGKASQLGNQGGGQLAMIEGYIKDFEKGADAVERGEVGLTIMAAAPVVAAAICTYFLGAAAGESCAKFTRFVNEIMSTVGDALNEMFGGGGGQHAKYRGESIIGFNKASKGITSLARLVAMKEQGAIDILLGIFRSVLSERYCWQSGRGGSPGSRVRMQELLEKYYKVGGNGEPRRLLPLTSPGSIWNLEKSWEPLCGRGNGGISLDDLKVTSQYYLKFIRPEEAGAILNRTVGNFVYPGTNIHKALARPQDDKPEYYFMYWSGLLGNNCTSAERFQDFVPWYVNDLTARSKDIDAALGGAMSEIEGMAVAYWKQSGKPDCAGVRQAIQMAEREERVQSAYLAKSAYKAQSAYQTKISFLAEQEAAKAASSSTTTWLLLGAAGVGLAWYFWPKKR